MPLIPLIDTWEEDFLEEFSKCDIDNVDNYVKENREVIIFLHKSKDGFDEKIEKILGEFIIKRVREYHYLRLSRGCSPESFEPEYLAYALQEQEKKKYFVFSFDELRRINLGDDSSRTAFIRKYSEENLLKKEFQRRFIALFE